MRLRSVSICLALTVAGCTPSVNTIASPSISPSSPTPSVTKPESPAPLVVGDKASISDGDVTVQLLKLQKGKVEDRDSPTYVALARLCNVGLSEPIGPGWEPWSIVDTNDGQFLASTETYTGDPTPAYPFVSGERALDKGDCAKGWIVFEVEKGTEPRTVEYDNDSGEHLQWMVP